MLLVLILVLLTAETAIIVAILRRIIMFNEFVENIGMLIYFNFFLIVSGKEVKIENKSRLVSANVNKCLRIQI